MNECPDFKMASQREAVVVDGTCEMIPGGLCPYVEEKKIVAKKAAAGKAGR